MAIVPIYRIIEVKINFAEKGDLVHKFGINFLLFKIRGLLAEPVESITFRKTGNVNLF